jgi:hypothetical protein
LWKIKDWRGVAAPPNSRARGVWEESEHKLVGLPPCRSSPPSGSRRQPVHCGADLALHAHIDDEAITFAEALARERANILLVAKE